MLRSQLLVFISLTAQAAIWPPALQEFSRKGEPRPMEAGDVLLQEYGVVAGEEAEYTAGNRSFQAWAYRFKDATGAVAARQAMADRGTARGNYLVVVHKGKLSRSELDRVFHDLPEFREPPAPTLPTYLPKGLTADSIRYVLGPESLKRFLPGIQPQLAGLDLGAEAETGQATLAGKAANFAIFRYPTPQIARLKAGEFAQSLPLAVTRRSGPLVAVLWPQEGVSLDPKVAETFLAPIEFRAVVIENEANPNAPIRDAAKMILSIFVLAGALLLACLAAGALFGGIRVLVHRKEDRTGALQTLQLRD